MTAQPDPTQCSARVSLVQKRRSLLWRVLRAVSVTLVGGLFVLLVLQVVHHGRGTRLVKDVRSGRNPAAPSFDLSVIWPHTETWPRELRSAVVDSKVSLRELRGYPVVINFWASWCGPCKAEASRLTDTARLHSRRVVFLGIDVQDFKGDARKFLREFDTNYVSLRDGSGSTFSDYGLTGVPETYWIDSHGRIVAHYPGEISRERLEQGIAEATRSDR